MCANRNSWTYWPKLQSTFAFIQKFAPENIPEETSPKAPWYLPNEYKELEPSLKKQILLLSEEKWNFMKEVSEKELGDWKWKLDLEVAQYCLDNDKKLEELRFLLVPFKVSEENFWRNYFARVHLIKQKLIEISPPKTIQKQENNIDNNIINNNNNNINNNINNEPINVEPQSSNIPPIASSSSPSNSPPSTYLVDLNEQNRSILSSSLSPAVSVDDLKRKFELEIQKELDEIDYEIDLELSNFDFDSTVDFDFSENEIKDLLAC